MPYPVAACRGRIAGAGAAAAFSPLSIPGLQLWLKADAGVYSDAGTTPAVNDAPVQQWNDQSGNGNNVTQATEANRPVYKTNVLNGKPVLRFTAASGHRLAGTITSITGNEARSFCSVQKYGSSGAQMALFIGEESVGKAFLYSYVPTNQFLGQWGDDLQGSVDISDDWVLSQGTKTADASPVLTIYNNAAQVLQGTRSAANITSNALVIGDGSDIDQYMNGDIAEVIVYGTLLTEQNLAALAEYLNGKYAIY